MKYMLMFVGRKGGWEELSESARQEAYGRINEWFERNHTRIVEGNELQPDDTATTVRFDSGKPVVTAGPFLEAKESIGGYAIVEVRDLDEALELARTWPSGATVEVRPVVERPASVPAG
ncbi:MAG TPA: YciI family protein [Candidatus Limnocylindrales bacterium]|nr:YciI family protein [Candidatus Limnocylindrales bacterium]